MRLHCRCVGVRHHQSGTDTALGADSAEDVSPSGALIVGRTRTCAALGPSARDLVLLSDPRFVLWDGSPPPRRIRF